MHQEEQITSRHSEFEDSADRPQVGLLREFCDFLIHSKKWWIIPIVVVLLAIGACIVIGGSVAGPFIYTLF